MKHVVIYILIAIFVVSCGNSVEEQERMTRAERQRLLHEDSLALKFAVLPTADCMPLFLAKEKRMFDTLGVDVRLVEPRSIERSVGKAKRVIDNRKL